MNLADKLLIGSLVILLVNCTPNAPNKQLHDKFLNKLKIDGDKFKSKNLAYTIVDIDSLSGLNWKHLYFFHENSGYPTDEGMSRAIGLPISSGGIISNGTRIVFTGENAILAVVNFSQSEALWLYVGEKYDRLDGNKFAFYTNCSYVKSYNLLPLQYFDKHKSLSGEFYKRCY